MRFLLTLVKVYSVVLGAAIPAAFLIQPDKGNYNANGQAFINTGYQVYPRGAKNISDE